LEKKNQKRTISRESGNQFSDFALAKQPSNAKLAEYMFEVFFNYPLISKLPDVFAGYRKDKG